MEMYIFSQKSDATTAEKMKSDALHLLLTTMNNHGQHISEEDVNYTYVFVYIYCVFSNVSHLF